MFRFIIIFVLLPNLTLASPDVAGGNHHAYIVTTGGEVLSMGQDLHKPEKGGKTYVGGKLGRKIDKMVLPGKDIHSILAQANYNPGRRKVQGLEGLKIVSIASGQNDGAAITEDGKLFMWGPNNHGQLGLGDKKQRRIATHVPIPGKVNSVAIGSAHALVVTEGGRVFSMGLGDTKVLGHHPAETLEEPKLIKALLAKKVIQVAAGQNTHSLFLTENGEVFACGSNRHGQLGIEVESSPIPIKVPLASKIKYIAVGVHTSFGVDLEGRLWGWGSGRKGHFPVENFDDFVRPTLFENTPNNLTAVAAGSRHTVVLTETGEVFTWGLHTMISGQLGIGPLTERIDVRVPRKVRLPEKVTKIDSMANNVFVVAGDMIFGWGQTSHGRLGRPKNGAHKIEDGNGAVYHMAHSPVLIPQEETPE